MSLSEVMNGIGMAYGWRMDVGLNDLHGEVNCFEPSGFCVVVDAGKDKARFIIGRVSVGKQ